MTIISQDNQVIMMNSAAYGMKILQESMKDEAEKAGIASADDIVNIVSELRSDEEV